MTGFARLPIPQSAMPQLGKAERSHILARLERLHTLLDQLDQTTLTPARGRHLRQLMQRELAAAKKAVKKLRTHDRARSHRSYRGQSGQ